MHSQVMTAKHLLFRMAHIAPMESVKSNCQCSSNLCWGSPRGTLTLIRRKEGRRLNLSALPPVMCLSVALAAATTGAGHDIFLKCIEIAKINSFDLKFQIFHP
jgi:hypothetical protein